MKTLNEIELEELNENLFRSINAMDELVENLILSEKDLSELGFATTKGSLKIMKGRIAK